MNVKFNKSETIMKKTYIEPNIEVITFNFGNVLSITSTLGVGNEVSGTSEEETYEGQ